MNKPNTIRWKIIALAVGLLLSVPVGAEKPSWSGNDDHGKQKHSGKHEKHEAGRSDGNKRNGDAGFHFDDRQKTSVREHYGQELRRGHCPPGLSKKHNGCMPPGQAKKWKVGRTLPKDVIYHDLPPKVVIELGTPPAGHRYVRVAADILLIAIGTGIVIDAIEDLGNI